MSSTLPIIVKTFTNCKLKFIKLILPLAQNRTYITAFI